MGKYRIHIPQLLCPGRIPLQADKATVIDGAQGIHHLAHGELALAQETVAVLIGGILHMDMADESAQVADGVLRTLAADVIRLMHIPQSAQIVAGEKTQQIPQLCGVSEGTHGLNEQGDAVLLRLVQGGIEEILGSSEGVFALGGTKPQEGDTQLLHDGGGLVQLLQCGGALGGHAHIRRQIQTGNRQLQGDEAVVQGTQILALGFGNAVEL